MPLSKCDEEAGKRKEMDSLTNWSFLVIPLIGRGRFKKQLKLFSDQSYQASVTVKLILHSNEISDIHRM